VDPSALSDDISRALPSNGDLSARFFAPEPNSALAFPIPTINVSQQACAEFCTERDRYSECGSLWPFFERETPDFSSAEYRNVGEGLFVAERRGAAVVGEATLNLLKQAFGILSVHLDLVEWSACCMEGDYGKLSLRRFLRDRILGKGGDYGKERTWIQVISSSEEIPKDDTVFDDADEFAETAKSAHALAESVDRIYIFPENCFWGMWRSIQNRHAPEHNGLWSLMIAHLLVHEMVHQFGYHLKTRGLAHSETEYYFDRRECSYPGRVSNTFMWAMLQRFPNGRVFSDSAPPGEGWCAEEARLFDRSTGTDSFYPYATHGYNFDSPLVETRSVANCLKTFGWDFGLAAPDDGSPRWGTLTYPCDISTPG
jgi:hypothetical protein